MTEITFHVQVGDRLAYACRLLRKAFSSGAKVVVCAPADLRDALDRALWEMAPHDFVAHCRVDSAAASLAASPIVLALPDQLGLAAHRQVLVNITQTVPAGFGSFERFIEIVGTAEADVACGRERWKHYRDRGYSLKTAEAAATSAEAAVTYSPTPAFTA